ncbi:MAG TPA: ribosome biogenesis GTPase Der [Chloroflexota bacterium]|nr:ribosome biogenesis GTPase Der [Chloroflexota bacterium]
MPIVALVGRPNVGKSTLFNRLIGEHRAVVHEKPGTTRDRLYGTAEWRDREFTVIDTGGIGLDTGEGDLLADVRLQADEAMRQADLIVWVVDASTGLTGADYEVADQLRPSKKPVILTANKAENQRRQLDAMAEFSTLGFGDEPVLISALHGEGTGDLLDEIVEWFPKAPAEEETAPAVSIAIVGRPNVGKSSLVNSLVGSRRSIVRDEAGTTRDAIDSDITREGQTIRLIDTAGIRRRGKVQPGVEKFSVMRAVRAIERADVAVLLIDATEGVLAQDTHVAGYVDEAAKGLIVAVNKWDLVEKHPKTQQEYTATLRQELKFADWAPVIYLSAKTGQRVDKVLSQALAIQAERTKRVPTPQLNDVIRKAIDIHPLTERGRALKVYYSAQTGSAPPKFTLFTNDPKMIHFSYVRYLDNTMRANFGFDGTPIRIEFRGRNEGVH